MASIHMLNPRCTNTKYEFDFLRVFLFLALFIGDFEEMGIKYYALCIVASS